MLLNSPSNSNTRIRMNNYPRRKSPAAWPCPFLFSRFTSMSVFSIFVDARGCWNERENTGAKGRTGRTEKTRTKKEEVSEIDIELTRAVSSMPVQTERKPKRIGWNAVSSHVESMSTDAVRFLAHTWALGSPYISILSALLFDLSYTESLL